MTWNAQPRWLKLSVTIGVLLVLIVWAFWLSGKKQNMTTSSNPPVTTSAPSVLNMIEGTIREIQESLSGLTSRVEALEKKKPAPQVTARVPATRTPVSVPAVHQPVPTPITLPPIIINVPPTSATDLTPIERVLGEIVEGLRRSSESLPLPPAAKPLQQERLTDPCASWVQDIVRYRRCRLYHQLP